MEIDFDREYERTVEPLEELGKFLVSLLSQLLERNEIQFHRVDYRVKAKKSVERKIARPRKGPNGPRTLDTITDLLGIRVITYFRDEVDAAARVIAEQFTIDQANSVDKRAALDADRFGYLSLHYIAELAPNRAELPENEKFGGVKFEVQIRSILQHAWAEIEHDLGYKSQAAVPRAVRRQFSRLAGVLELVDDAFVGIRQEIGQYKDEAEKAIGAGEVGVEINQDSLAAFVTTSPRVADLDERIAHGRNTTVQDRIDTQFLGHQAEDLVSLGFQSIQDLNRYLEQHGELLVRFAERWLALAGVVGRTWRVPVPIGITLYYAGWLRCVQDMSDGKKPQHTYGTHRPELLRRALSEATETG